MNVRKSASLTASVCSLCITASLVTAPPHAAAAALPATQHRTVSVVDQPYALTASSQQIIEDLLVVAGIPFQNFYTTLNALGGVTVFVTNTNKALGAVYTGQWDLIPAYLQAAWDDEAKAIDKIIALPQTLIDYNTKAIENLLASLGAGGPTPVPLEATAGAPAARAATGAASAAATQEDIFKDVLVVAGIPFQNFYTTLNTLGGVTVFVTNTNKALGAVYTGQWDLIPAYLQAAWDDEAKAIDKIIALPQTLIDYNTKAIENLLANFTPDPPTATPYASSSRIQTAALESAAPQEEKAISGNAAVETPEIKGATEPKTIDALKSTETETPTDKPAVKPAAADTDKESDGETGASGPGKRAAFGKHARRGDAANSTPSAAAGASATGSTPGRHRKLEGKTAGASAPSTGGSATAGS